jgi:pimeloyl-ACP methyl ester carboxylesterase
VQHVQHEVARLTASLVLTLAPMTMAQPQSPPPSTARTGEEVREQVRTALNDIGRIVSPHGIDESRIVQLGGAKQWIMLRGQDRRAPILLFLHGGPGSPISSIVWSYQRPWEDFFLVVHWDQRGFGRSYDPSQATRLTGTLNKEQVIADAIELIEMLRRQFGQQKIILVGQSWGTVLTLEIARRRPDLLYAAVTQGLAVNWLESPRILYRSMLSEAERTGDSAEARRLRDVGPLPPATEAAALFAWTRKFGLAFPDSNTWHNIRGPGDSWRRRIDALQYISPDYPADVLEAEQRADADAAGRMARYQEAMTPVLRWDAERDVGTKFTVPLIVMQGSHDWQTHVDLARAYYGKVCAPWKKWIEFPNAAHALNIEQPGLSVVALVNDVLPSVRNEVPAGAEQCREAR